MRVISSSIPIWNPGKTMLSVSWEIELYSIQLRMDDESGSKKSVEDGKTYMYMFRLCPHSVYLS
jgi:hypothetical protein